MYLPLHHALKALQQAGVELHTLELTIGEQTVARYTKAPFDPKIPSAIFSMSKSFVGIAALFAVSECLLDLHAPITRYFPDVLWKGQDKLETLTVEHLLSMRTGMAYGDDIFTGTGGQGLTARILALPFEEAPGTVFRYQSTATYLLSAMLQQITGQTVAEYLEPRLFAPLGFQEHYWEHCPDGISYGAYGLYLRLRDITATFRLLRDKGVWQGEQLLPKALIKQATAWHALTDISPRGQSRSGYGWQLWLDGDGIYHGAGYYGQYSFVIPKANAVLSFTAASNDKQAIFDSLWHTLIPALLTGELPTEGCEEILDAFPCPIGAAGPYHLGEVYQMKPNIFGIQRIGICADGLQLETDTQVCILRAAHNRWSNSDLQLGRQPILFPFETPALYSLAAASYGWEGKDILQLRIAFLQTPFVYDAIFRFVDNYLSIEISANVGQGTYLQGEQIG